MRNSRGYGVRWAAMLLLCGCAAAPQSPAGRLTLVRDRLTDQAIVRDLAVFSALERRLVVAATTNVSRQYLITRASASLALGREAYERNDRSAFPEDMLVLAERDEVTLERGEAHVAAGARAAT